MLRGLHLPLPPDAATERKDNERLTTFLEFAPEIFSLSIGPYQHGDEPPEPAEENASRRGILQRLLRRRRGEEAE
jgi:hypothetical protein